MHFILNSILRSLVCRFVTATDAFKFKEFNVQSKQCRKTSLAPRFGSPVNKLVPVPRVSASTASSQQQRTEQLSSDKQPLTGSSGSRASNMFAFATPYRVIGLSSFPLTGDPSQVNLLLPCLVHASLPADNSVNMKGI